MASHAREILRRIAAVQRRAPKNYNLDSYILSGHLYYYVSVPMRRRIARTWLKENATLSDVAFLEAVSGLFAGKSHEEKTVASYILGYAKTRRRAVSFSLIDRWLSNLNGWAEVDAFCSSIFTPDEMLADWASWKAFIRKISRSSNINKRRAALVFFTNAVRQSPDPRLKVLALEMVDRLKHERPIIITKAISWVLRDLSYNHKKDLIAYLKKNEDTLPKIALRETWRKLTTGRK